MLDSFCLSKHNHEDGLHREKSDQPQEPRDDILLAQSKQIDKMLKVEAAETKRKNEQSAQVLVLGAASSGKTTFMKQMKLKFGKGFDEKDVNMYREVIYYNMCDGLVTLSQRWNFIDQYFDENIKNIMEQQRKDIVETWKLTRSKIGFKISEIPESFQNLLKILYENGTLKRLILDQVDLECNDGFLYFFSEKFDSVMVPSFKPNTDDIFHCRVATESVTTHTYVVDDYTYHFVDVSGQKSRRMKWLTYFEGATNVMLFVPLGNYNQNLFENRELNMLTDSLALFDVLVNNVLLKNVSFILMLNKVDLFRTKLAKFPLNLYLKDYDGDGSEANACKFVKQTFLKIVANQNQQVKVHFTHATDSKAMSVIIDSIMSSIIQQNLRAFGISE